MIHHPGGAAMAAPMVASAGAHAPTVTMAPRVAGTSAVISNYGGQPYTTYASPAAAQTLTAPSQALGAITAAPGQPAMVQQPQPQTAKPIGGSAATGAVPPPGIPMQQTAMMAPPATPKIQTATAGTAPRVMAAPPQGVAPNASGTFPAMRAPMPQQVPQQMLTREQALEQRVRELEHILGQKDAQIKELQAALSKAGVKVSIGGSIGAGGLQARGPGAPQVVVPAAATGAAAGQTKVRSPGRTGSSGFRKISGSKPNNEYQAADQDCQIDVRLEEWYNSTGSAVPFRRINRGFYRFGDTIAELDIINHKLMARTEDGWNRGKFGPIDKFMMYYENIEREKAGLAPEA